VFKNTYVWTWRFNLYFSDTTIIDFDPLADVFEIGGIVTTFSISLIVRHTDIPIYSMLTLSPSFPLEL